MTAADETTRDLLREAADQLDRITPRDFQGRVDDEAKYASENLAQRLRTAALASAPPQGEAVRSKLLPNRTGRDECVDIAMDYIDNSIEHVEECKSNTRDANDERHDCDCAVGDGLRELERLARLTHPAPPRETRSEAAILAAARERVEALQFVQHDESNCTMCAIDAVCWDRIIATARKSALDAALAALTPTPEAK